MQTEKMSHIGKYCIVMDIGKPSEPTKRIVRVLTPNQVSGLITDSNSDESNSETANVIGQWGHEEDETELP